MIQFRLRCDEIVMGKSIMDVKNEWRQFRLGLT